MGSLLPFAKPEKQIAESKLEYAIANDISEGHLTTADAIAERYDVPVQVVVDWLNSDAFLESITKFTTAKLTLAYHGLAINKLVGIIQKGDDKTVISAINTLAKINGAIKTGNKVDLHITLEQALTELDESEPVQGDKAALDRRSAIIDLLKGEDFFAKERDYE